MQTLLHGFCVPQVYFSPRDFSKTIIIGNTRCKMVNNLTHLTIEAQNKKALCQSHIENGGLILLYLFHAHPIQ